MSQPFCKPDQTIQPTVDTILQSHLRRKPSQQSYPTVFSQWYNLPSPNSDLKHLPCPKIDHNNRLHLPKDITSRHAQTHLKAYID